MASTHRRRRRDKTVLSRRRRRCERFDDETRPSCLVGGVNENPTRQDGLVLSAVWTEMKTRRNRLVSSAWRCERTADATKQSRLVVGVNGYQTRQDGFVSSAVWTELKTRQDCLVGDVKGSQTRRDSLVSSVVWTKSRRDKTVSSRRRCERNSRRDRTTADETKQFCLVSSGILFTPPTPTRQDGFVASSLPFTPQTRQDCFEGITLFAPTISVLVH